MTKHNIFIISPSRVGGYDMLIPLILDLKETSDVRVVLLVTHFDIYQKVRNNDFFSALSRKCFDKVIVLRSDESRNKLVSSLLLIFSLFRTIINISWINEPILLHSVSLKSRFARLLKKVVYFKKGKIYAHFNGLSIVVGRKAEKTAYITDQYEEDGDAFLSFGPLDRDYLESQGRVCLIEIGYPRLYKSWLLEISRKIGYYKNKLEQDSGVYNKDESVGLFLGSTLEGVFSLTEIELWINEIFEIVDQWNPLSTVLIKPHPCQNFEHLNRVLNKRKKHNFRVLDWHPAIIAKMSTVVISHHSSTILDSLAVGTKTIFYQAFSPHWLDRHPEKSVFLQLGPIYAKDKIELKKALFSKPDVDKPDIRDILIHKDASTSILQKVLMSK